MPSSAADPVARVRDTVRATIAEERLRLQEGSCLVAVSGGADSTCLLDVLVALYGPDRPIVVHIDHGFRPDSIRDAAHVTALATRLGVTCEVVRVDGPAFADEHRIGLEMAGRVLRYRAFAEVGERSRRSTVATGHTRDDNVESVLLHLLRGSGLDGLGGISAQEPLGFRADGPAPLSPVPDDVKLPLAVRPLLHVGRAETVAYCVARGLEWVVDPTNDDPRHLRNRVRHHLLPVLRTYNPSVDAALERTARLLRDDREWIERQVTRRWRHIGTLQDATAMLDVRRFARQPVALRRRLIRHAVEQVGGHPDTLSFEAVERALGVAASDGVARAQLGSGLVVLKSGDMVAIRREGVAST